MNRFSELRTAVSLYKQRIDKIISDYAAEDKKAKEIYSETEYARRHAENLGKARSAFSGEQEAKIRRVNGVLEGIQEQLIEWVSAPVGNTAQLQLVNSLFATGVKLTADEIEALQGSVGNNYFAGRLVAQLAEKSGIHTKSKFNLDVYTNALQNCKTELQLYISSYCGNQKIGIHRELLPDNHKPMSDKLCYAAASCKPLSGRSSLLLAGSIWDGDSLPGTDSKISTTQRDLLDEIFDGCQTENDFKNVTERIIHELPEIKEVLNQTKYKTYMKEGNVDVSE